MIDDNTYGFTWTFRVNSPQTWRQRVGYALRSLASRIDGLFSLGVEMQTEPPLTRRQQRDVLVVGMGHARRALIAEVETEALEGVFRRVRADLFEGTGG